MVLELKANISINDISFVFLYRVFAAKNRGCAKQ